MEQPTGSRPERDARAPDHAGHHLPAPRDPGGADSVAMFYSFIEELLAGNRTLSGHDLLADDFVAHEQEGDLGREAFLKLFDDRRRQHPFGIWTIDLLTSVGPLVVCHGTMQRLDDGASGRPTAQVRETIIARFASGRIEECWRASAMTKEP